MPSVARRILVPGLCAPLLLAGCRAIGALGVLFAPPQIQKAEFELTAGRLALVFDYARPEQANPVFDRTLHERIAEQFRENKVVSQVVPYDDVVRLQQANTDFSAWSVQKIGRSLNAEQVLYVRIDQLRLRWSLAEPVLTPQVDLHLKVVGGDGSGAAGRLWPDKDTEPDGRVLSGARPPREVDSASAVDAETTKLAREVGVLVARHFHKYDLEEKPPREP